MADTGNCLGDSVMAGLNASDAAHRCANLITTAKSWTLAQLAVGGTQVVDQCAETSAAGGLGVGQCMPYRSTAVTTALHWIWLAGYNDMRHSGTDTDNLETVRRTMRAAIAWMCRLDANKYQGNNVAWTKVGTWVSVGFANLTTAYSSTVNDTATMSFTGTACTLCYVAHFNSGADGGKFTTTIDSVSVGSEVDTNFGSVSGYTNAGNGGATRYTVMGIRYSGLSAGSHSFELKVSSAGIVQVAFLVGNDEAVHVPIWISGPMTMVNYAGSGDAAYDNGSAPAVALYVAMIKALILEANQDNASGVRYAPLTTWNPATGMSVDTVHPNDTGHAQLAVDFLAEGNPVTFTFNNGQKQLMSGGSVSWAADTIMARLVDDAVTPAINDTTIAGYTAIGTDATLGTKTLTNDTTNHRTIHSAANPTIASPAAAQTYGSVVIYKHVTDDSDSIPLFCLALTPDVTTGIDLLLSVPSTGLGATAQ